MTLEVRTLNADDYPPLSFDEAVALTDEIRVSVAPGMYPLLAPTGKATLRARAKANRKRQKATRSNAPHPARQRQHSERVILAAKADVNA